MLVGMHLAPSVDHEILDRMPRKFTRQDVIKILRSMVHQEAKEACSQGGVPPLAARKLGKSIIDDMAHAMLSRLRREGQIRCGQFKDGIFWVKCS